MKRLSGLPAGFGLEWSCGPQFASENGVTDAGLSGNLMKDWSLVFLREWKAIPNVLVPLRYWMTLLQASRWPVVAQWLYHDIRLVIVVISGLVEIASHCKEPVNCCILCVM